MGLSAIYVYLGRISEATKLARKGLAHGPGNPQSLYQLGLPYEALDFPRQARKLYEKALSLKPKDEKLRSALRRSLDRIERGSRR